MIFHFNTDLRCILTNGEQDIVRGFVVSVEADSLTQAHDLVQTVATEFVHDLGSQLLDAPLDHLDVIVCVSKP